MLRNQMKQVILLIIMVILVSGCGSYPILPSDSLLSPSNEDAIIIVGAKLGEGNLSSMLMSLYVGGKKMPLKGIVKKGFYKESLPQLVPINIWKNANYIEADEKNHTYRVWRIPKKLFSENGKSLLYVSVVRSKENKSSVSKEDIVWAKMYRTLSMWEYPPAPITSMQKPLWFDDPEWQYVGIKMNITKPGIYYLGELSVVGTLNKKQLENGEKHLTLLFGAKHYKDIDSFKKFLSDNHMSSESFYNYSNFGSNELKGADFLNSLKGKNNIPMPE